MKKLLLVTLLLSSSAFGMSQSNTKNPALQTNCLTKGHFANVMEIDKKLQSAVVNPVESETNSRELGSN